MRVLLVDDHPIFRQGLALLLASIHPGLHIEQCTLPKQLALLLEQAGNKRIDLALIDLQMPGFQGVEALTYFRSLAPDIPVVVVSSDEDPDTVKACIDQGAFGYVPKSADSSVLIEAMERILGGGVWLPGGSLRAVSSDTQLPTKPDGDWVERLQSVTERQRDVLQRVVQGKTNKVIGRELGISDGTVKTHLAHLMSMLCVHTRTHLVYELARQGIKVDDLPKPDVSARGTSRVTSG